MKRLNAFSFLIALPLIACVVIAALSLLPILLWPKKKVVNMS